MAPTGDQRADLDEEDPGAVLRHQGQRAADRDEQQPRQGGGPGDRGEEPGEGFIGSLCAIGVFLILAFPLSSVAYSLLVLETIILVSFGFSWFVKGRKILSGG